MSNFRIFSLIELKEVNQMKPEELFNKVKDLIETKDFDGAKKFIEENKDKFGEYLEQAKTLLAGSEGASGLLDKVKNLF